jgi:hypothetical protein
MSLVALAAIFVVDGAAAAQPTFSNPLTFTNRFQPFRAGAMKVFTGRKEGKATVDVDLYLDATRTFRVGDAEVATRILQESAFEAGSLVEISRNFFAQADDGTVYYFGEVVDIYENGAVVDHEGSWLVGGPTEPGDPRDAGNASAPTVFMPATPEVGDTFKPEDLLPIVDETDEVTAVGVRVRVPAGRYDGAIRVVETTELDPADRETKWYAPGVGVVKAKARGESLVLVASSLLPE